VIAPVAAARRWLDAPESRVAGWQRPARFGLRLAVHAGSQLMRDRANLMAAAITYRTVFALVPVLVVSLVVLRFFLGSDAISQGLNALLEQFGLTNLSLGEPEPGEEGPATVAQWLESVVQRAETINFGAIGAVGAALLVYASVSMLIQIEQCFNVICAAPAGRKMTTRLTTYWTMLTLGPLGIIASLTLGSRLGDAVQAPGGIGAGVIDSVLSLGISWLILIAAYMLIPNARVKLRPAAIGALLAAVLWEFGKFGFRSYLGFSTGYATLYGSLGLVPVFFLWVYLTWFIVLLGLEITRALQVLTDPTRRNLAGDAPPDPACGLAMMVEGARRFATGAALQLDEAAAAGGLPPRRAETVLARLRDAGFLHEVEQSGESPAFALTAPPERTAAADVARALVDDDGAGGVRGVLFEPIAELSLAELASRASPADRQ